MTIVIFVTKSIICSKILLLLINHFYSKTLFNFSKKSNKGGKLALINCKTYISSFHP